MTQFNGVVAILHTKLSLSAQSIVRPQATPSPSPHRPRTLLASLLLLAWTLHAHAPLQAGTPPAVHTEKLSSATDRRWQVQSLSDAAGLSGLRIFDLCFSSQGDLWLATSGGLYQYDGYTWRVYGQAEGLPSSFTRCVLFDRNGALWVGSDRGAGIFEPSHLTYTPQGGELELQSHSVRHIDEDPDGSLWFSCDRWPDTSVAPGALLRLSRNSWSRFDTTNGLPMAYVIGHHRDAQGRHRAFTAQGWVEREGDHWRPPSDPGYSPEARVLHMAEDKDGNLFAQAEGLLLRRIAGHWKKLPDKTLAIHRTGQGELLAIERNAAGDNFWFSRWNGTAFERASAPQPLPAGSIIYGLREAPDHSVWCVGTGILTRWTRNSGPWQAHPQLPPPLRRDASGRIWFHGGEELFWLDHDGLHRSPVSYNRILGFDADGAVLALREGESRPVTLIPGSPEAPPAAPCPLASVTHASNDQSGRLWLLGSDSAKNLALARRKGDGWKIVTAKQPFNGVIFALRPDGTDGIAFTQIRKRSTDYDVFRADDSGITQIPIPEPHPPLNYPTFLNAAGSAWLQGYAGVFQCAPGARPYWERAPGSPSQGFNTIIGNDKELVTVFRGPRDASAGALSFDGRQWRRYSGEFNNAYYGDCSGRLYLRARNGIHIRTTLQSESLEYIPLPENLTPNSLVEDADSSLWLGSPEGVLHYVPGNEAPETGITAPVNEIGQGNALPIVFHGLRRWQPASTTDAFQFSWRINEGPWGPYRRLNGPTLDISMLHPGAHLIEARSRDAEGNIDASPARFAFTITPLPLQNRPWFPYAVGGLTALVIGLAWLGISRGLRLARGNTKLRKEIDLRSRIEKALEEARDQLELRVAQRTADLQHANDELKHEIHERHELEKLRNGLEEQLLQAQKMQAIGTLAGGIAHDFNNILAIITPCTRLALEECIANPEARENLQQVLAASERARSLVQQILTFSRRQHTNKVPLDLGAALEEALRLMRSALGSGIRMHVSIEPNLPPILADATQIHQVIINLCTNAQQALPDGRGRIDVSLKSGGAPAPAPDAFMPIPPPPFLTLLVSDNGIGMEPDLIERIFDPFFTTKPTGKGTGLGLSVVDGIVKSHGGHIVVTSTTGEGSTFAVSLPVHVPTNTPTPDTTEIAQAIPVQSSLLGTAATQVPGNDEETTLPKSAATHSTPERPSPAIPHILLVDDEPAVSRPLRIILERAGFAVTVHASPQDAHSAFKADPNHFDLLLTDHTMSGMTGPDLAARLREQRPGLPVILVTGYGGAWTPGDAARIGIQKILTKPVDPTELVAEVREAMAFKPCIADNTKP